MELAISTTLEFMQRRPVPSRVPKVKSFGFRNNSRPPLPVFPYDGNNRGYLEVHEQIDTAQELE